MTSKWLSDLKEEEREESKHNNAAALRERQNRHPVGPVEKTKTPINPPSKTSKTTKADDEKLKTRPMPPSKTSRTPKTTEAEELGLVATWSVEFGYVALHDPTSGEWHDLRTKDAPEWPVREARKRKELYRDGNRKAYRLTSQEMEEIWETERPLEEEGIVEDYPVEEEGG